MIKIMKIVRFGTYLKKCFGERVQRVSLHAGLTCPNRDGSVGTGGCIYCDNGSFHPGLKEGISISDQIIEGMARATKRYGANKFLAYFQTFSNTYAEPATLRSLYQEALAFDQVVGLMIATRPDCIDAEIVRLLEEFSRHTMLWVELGIQTMHDSTLQRLNRGHTRRQTEHAVHLLRKADSIHTASHIILGLPDESKQDMMQTADWFRDLGIEAVKLHHLHAVRGTRLENMYRSGDWQPLKADEYIDLAAAFLRRQNDGLIIMRLVAECPDAVLVAPRWPQSKMEIENAIVSTLKDNGILTI